MFKIGGENTSRQRAAEWSPPVCNPVSVSLQLFCEGLRGLLENISEQHHGFQRTHQIGQG